MTDETREAGSEETLVARPGPAGEVSAEGPLPSTPASDDQFDLFLTYTAELRAARERSFEAFDRAVLTLSTAALGVSLGFVKEVVDLADAQMLPLLIGSWIGFGTAILSTVGSFISSRMALDAQIRLAEAGYLGGDEEALATTPLSARVTNGLNWLSASAFAIGVVLTVWFVAINLIGVT